MSPQTSHGPHLTYGIKTPAFVPLSQFRHESLVKTPYITSVFLLFLGFAPLIWAPIANIYGRRPVYIITLILSVATAVGSGAAPNYAGLLTLRAFNGLGAGAPGGLGCVTVCDLFFQHERGLYMGIFTVALINGGHLAPVIGGYVAKNLSWHWCFYILVIIGAVMVVVLILCLPETLYPRSQEALQQPQRTWVHNMTCRGKIHPTRRLQLMDFVRPLQMLKYPSVLIPAIYYSVSFGYASILFIISSANTFARIYKFQPYQTGLLLGLPLTIGTLLGELMSGGFSDWVRYKIARSNGTHGKKIDCGLYSQVLFSPHLV
jgi:MFS family permease